MDGHLLQGLIKVKLHLWVGDTRAVRDQHHLLTPSARGDVISHSPKATETGRSIRTRMLFLLDFIWKGGKPGDQGELKRWIRGLLFSQTLSHTHRPHHAGVQVLQTLGLKHLLVQNLRLLFGLLLHQRLSLPDKVVGL